jgi:hypothetical protein
MAAGRIGEFRRVADVETMINRRRSGERAGPAATGSR